MTDDQEWLDTTAFAKAYGKTPLTVRRWCIAGKIRCRKIGTSWFVHRSELYDDDDEGSRRGEPVPAEARPSLGGDGDDAGRAPSIAVRRVEERGAARAPGAAAATGPRHSAGSARRSPWSLPPEVVG